MENETNYSGENWLFRHPPALEPSRAVYRWGRAATLHSHDKVPRGTAPSSCPCLPLILPFRRVLFLRFRELVESPVHLVQSVSDFLKAMGIPAWRKDDLSGKHSDNAPQQYISPKKEVRGN